MELVWETNGSYLWLREKGRLLYDSNHYDIKINRGVFTVKFVGRNGGVFQTGDTVAGPFDTLEDAKNVAEMLHRMEAWK